MRRAILLIISLIVLFSPSCGGGGGVAPLKHEQVQGSPRSYEIQPNASLPARNRLIARMPVLSHYSSGSEFEFILAGEFKDSLFQMSARILFDENIVSPVSVHRGDLIPGDAVFMAKLDRAGYIPLAFTRLPGQEGVSPGCGELLKVRFRLLSQPQPNFRIRLLNDPAYLQLRDKNRGRLSFDLATEVVSQ